VIRRAGRTLLVIRETSLLLTLGILLIAAIVLLDFTIRFPSALRLGLLACLGVALVFVYIKRFHPITRFRPPLADVASRAESWLDSRGIHPESALTGGVGLKPRDDDDPLTQALTRLASARIVGLLPSIPWGMLRLRRAAGAFAVLIVLSVSASFVFRAFPIHTFTGLTRLFLPLSGAAWPRLTSIADATPQEIHPSDSALPLRVTLLKSNKESGAASIEVRYRVVYADGSQSPESRALLVPQPSTSNPLAANPGELYERLVETSVWAPITGNNENQQSRPPQDRWLEYTFLSEDDRTATRRVRIVDPPLLRRVSSQVSPPAYADSLSEKTSEGRSNWLNGETETSIGEALIGPVLYGSTLRLTLEYSKPIEPNTLDLPESAVVSTEDGVVTIEMVPADSLGIVLGAVDANGLSTRENFTARVTVLRDHPPSATVIDPSTDQAVLATAVIPLIGEATDDLALQSVRLEYLIATPAADSLGAEPEPEQQAVVLSRLSTSLTDTETIESILDLQKTGAKPGQEIWVRVVAQDTFNLDGARHEPTFSTPRRIRIIEESRFIEMIRAELEGVRRTAISLDRRQAAVMQDAAENKQRSTDQTLENNANTLNDLAARQSEISQRLRGQTASLERLQSRLEQSRAQDAAIRSLVKDAAAAASSARAAADRAAGQAAAKAAGEPQADPTKEQQHVRDELSKLIDQLDRGQDDWVVRRALERLVESQRKLREQTAEFGDKSSGKSLDELSQDERTELERIAERQRELARQAQSAIDDLSQRADEIREKDPTQAAALDEAARRAAQQKLAEALQDAASQIGSNQTGAAGEIQDQSIEDLEAMLEQLENAKRSRDKALRRELASLIRSIQSLIRQQSSAIESLDGPIETAQARAQRVRTNTLAATADASEGFEEMNPIAELLDRATGSQLESIRALRSTPPTVELARSAENDALSRLNEALQEANKQDSAAAQREKQRKRRELIDAYREALADQAEIEQSTSENTPAGNQDKPTRRQRAALRTIGRNQEALRVLIKGIPDAFEVPPGVISLYHRRIDDSLASAVRRLGRGDTGEKVEAGQAAAAGMLRTIIEILSPQSDQPDDSFDDQQSGGGGGGGGADDQPPIGQLEELRLLRSLQSLVLEETRSAGSDTDQSLADIQSEIAEQARRIIESMKKPAPNQPAPQDPMPSPPQEQGQPG